MNGSSMRFTKMHGIGNDYVYVSTFDQKPPADPAALARAVSDRHFGIGGDGLILIMPSERADARMRMFNADGSEGEMCGNGVRCVAKYLYDHGLARQEPVDDRDRPRRPHARPRSRRRAGAAGPRRHGRADLRCRPRFPRSCPATRRSMCRSRSAIGTLAVTAVSMGNPHAVTYVADVGRLSARIRWAAGSSTTRRSPAGSTSTSSRSMSPGEVTMRTWERGSGITLACGTGACAVCVAGVLTGRTGRRLIAHLPGGDLELEWPDDHASVFMTGPATEVFSGEWPD